MVSARACRQRQAVLFSKDVAQKAGLSSAPSIPAAQLKTPETITDAPKEHCNRFRRHQRLIASADFQTVFKQSARSRDELFTVLLHLKHQPVARLGMAVPRKAVNRAVARNRIKRQIRESFRRASLPAADIVVLAKRRAANANSRQIRASLEQHWQNLRQKIATRAQGQR